MNRSRVSPAAGACDTFLARLLDTVPLRAGSFIVTLYGDVVEPRGGSLWMGNIVETCGAVGLSETLVRTAVSRLVAAGRLTGERQGRRSFYQLTEAARREFLSVSTLLFEPRPETGWRFVWRGADQADGSALEREGYVRIGLGWMLGPAHRPHPEVSGLVFDAGGPTGPQFREFAASHWDLAALHAAYDGFLTTFGGLAAELTADLCPGDAQALHLRLLLVHAYRFVSLPDPHLPADALPPDWSGHRAGRLFADLYLRLSPGADRFVGARFLGPGRALGSPLAARCPAVSDRLDALARLRGSA